MKASALRKGFGFLGVMLFFLPGLPLFPAEITVPRLEMATRGSVQDGDFSLSSLTTADIALNGGYKYGVLLGLSFESADLGKALAYRNFSLDPITADPNADDYNTMADRINNQAVLSFKIAQATARNLFNLPLELSYFIGLADNFCSGEDFTRRFGVSHIETDFKGFFYFPEGIGGVLSRQYNGIHRVQGTGLSLAFTKWDAFIPMVYAYQDISFLNQTPAGGGQPRYSGDLRFLINTEHVNMEAFGGISVAEDSSKDFRGGLLAYFSSGTGADFLFQGGIPNWQEGEDFSIDNIYFLMEPRISFGLFAFHVTFFYHPLQYLHIITEEERGKADINFKLLLGNMETAGIEGGFETTLGLKVNGMEDFSCLLSPFVSFIGDGLRWDLKVRVNPAAYEDISEMFEMFIGIRTAY
jgi:hypothetical protein